MNCPNRNFGVRNNDTEMKNSLEGLKSRFDRKMNQ